MESADDRYLVVRVYSHLCAIVLRQVIEVMRPLPIEAVSGMPQFLLGLSVVRDAPLPVIDLEAVLSGRTNGIAGRFVTLRIGERMAALAVQDVLGFRSIDRSELQALPPLCQNVNAETVEAIGTLDSQLLVVLQASRILPVDLWQTLSGREAAAP